jgi:hypothetical protein
MKTATFIIALLLCTAAYAQDLSKDKQLELRNAQVEYLQTKAQADQAQAQANAAQQRMGALVTEACKGAGLKNEECMVCDGPGPEGHQVDACKGLKPQELAVRKLDKPAEKGDLKPAVPTPYSKAKVDKP